HSASAHPGRLVRLAEWEEQGEPDSARGHGERVRRYVLGLILAAFAVPAAADLRREVEPNDPPAMAQPAVPPASLGGVISEPGDVDVFAVALQAGQTLEADILARGFRAGA